MHAMIDHSNGAAPQSAPALFTGERREFRQLAVRGAWLELVTVGFYRFWLATDIRRHLWAHTAVGGDAAEYTGRGKELFVGFLVALAILVPVYLLYFLAGLEAERLQAFASIPLGLFLYLFGQFAIYRARRYRLTRTVWRGVRFWMQGSGWAYAGRAFLWGLAMVLTVGLVLPWRDAALERYKMRHTFFGDLQGSFTGNGGEFFKRGWWLWMLTFVALIITPLVPFVYAMFRAVQWRWWIEGVRFGDVRFESNLRLGALIGLYWKVIGWLVLLFALFGAYLYAAMTLYAQVAGTSVDALMTAQNVSGQMPMIVIFVFGYLAVILAFNVVLRVYLTRDIWARVAGSITVPGLGAAANVAAHGALANAVGEGFADSLDVVGF
jgi:uncharacterized membrane protein YjgN (DUF898 family)